jgi:hypothetical protein
MGAVDAAIQDNAGFEKSYTKKKEESKVWCGF